MAKASTPTSVLALVAWALGIGVDAMRDADVQADMGSGESNLSTAMTFELGTQWQLWTGEPKYTDVHQGMLGDCYLLATLASIVFRHPQVISNFFTTHQRKKANGGAVYIMNFVANGRPTQVAVDDMVPYNPVYRNFYFTTTHDGEDIWPLLVEKGYAKLYGTFMGIRGGWDYQAVKDLTQAPAETVKVDWQTPGDRYYQNTDQLWQEMMHARSQQWPMFAGSRENQYGVPGGHAYAVLQVQTSLTKRGRHERGRFVQVYNPWGSKNLYRGSIKGQANDQGFYWMYFDEFLYIYKTFSWARIKRGYKLSFASSTIPLGAKKTLKFKMDSHRPFTLLLEWPSQRMAENARESCPQDSYKLLFQFWAARLENGRVVPNSWEIGEKPLFNGATNGRLDLKGTGTWIVYVYTEIAGQQNGKSWITDVAVNAYHHEEAGDVAFEETQPPQGEPMEILGGIQHCRAMTYNGPDGTSQISGRMSTIAGGPIISGRGGALWLHNGEWKLEQDPRKIGRGTTVEVTGCSSFLQGSLLETESDAAEALVAFAFELGNASAVVSSRLDCGYYVRRMHGNLNNADEIVRSGEDSLFPPRGQSIGTEKDDCGDSARGGPKESCMKFNNWDSISRVLGREASDNPRGGGKPRGDAGSRSQERGKAQGNAGGHREQRPAREENCLQGGWRGSSQCWIRSSCQGDQYVGNMKVPPGEYVLEAGHPICGHVPGRPAAVEEVCLKGRLGRSGNVCIVENHCRTERNLMGLTIPANTAYRLQGTHGRLVCRDNFGLE